jgi:hypothetical protein
MKLFINNYMFRQKSGLSLEDAIRQVQKKYRNVPSPLQYMQENVGFAPTQVPQHMRQSKNLRDNLLSGFIPSKDTFR